MDEQAAQCGATLAGGTHRREGDAAQREIEIRRGRDDGGIVAAELEQRARKALGKARANLPAHRGRAGRRNQRHAMILDDGGADVSATDHDLAEAFRHLAVTLGFETGRRAREDGTDRKRGERGLLGRLPDHRIAADKGKRRVPAPDRDREVEGGDDADRPEGVPRFHHPVARAFGRDGEAVKLAREADREIADVDHFLHFAEAFGGDFAGLERHKMAEFTLGLAEFVAEQADEFATLGRRHQPPLLKRLHVAADRGSHVLNGVVMDFRHAFAVDRRADDARAAGQLRGGKAEGFEHAGGFFFRRGKDGGEFLLEKAGHDTSCNGDSRNRGAGGALPIRPGVGAKLNQRIAKGNWNFRHSRSTRRGFLLETG